MQCGSGFETFPCSKSKKGGHRCGGNRISRHCRFTASPCHYEFTKSISKATLPLQRTNFLNTLGIPFAHRQITHSLLVARCTTTLNRCPALLIRLEPAEPITTSPNLQTIMEKPADQRPSNDISKQVILQHTIIPSVVTVFVALRFYSRLFYLRSNGWDDWLLLSGFVWLLSTCSS
jgi:hypothetical protein